VDILICVLALAIAYLIRFDFFQSETDWFQEEWVQIKYTFPVYVLIRALTFYFGKTYQGIIRYTSTQDTKRIIIALTLGTFLIAALSPVRFYYADGYYLLPRPIIILDYLICLFLMLSSRFLVKLAYLETQKLGKTERKIVIYGAGELGRLVKTTLDRESSSSNKIVAFVDDDRNMQGKRFEGVPIISVNGLDKLIRKNEINQLIVGILKPEEKKKRRVMNLCFDNEIETLSVPPLENWINGELSSSQIKKVRIEDLLGRDPIVLSKDNISKDLSGKVVLISGAAGSIGSELVRQIIQFEPKQMILLDQAESPLYDLCNESKIAENKQIIETVIADVSVKDRMENVFRTFSPEVVFHAAAYKHVPLMEDNPSEALNTNILGTKILADLADQYKVQKFVMVSTDKAVNPTNVMGASKRIAEIYCQTLNDNSDCQYVTTRFGNVLGSNGSVIPLFRRQIESGGPLTVTHEEITRYFMTIPEACQLVLEAGSMGEGGEIFVFDMGASIKIMDLAKKMIKLSGLELGKDIEIKVTGLRPGEKLYEELLNDEENTLPTHHDQILIGKVRTYEFDIIQEKVRDLCDQFADQNNLEIVRRMKHILPEFKSNNSIYTQLD